jgi:glycosyltransferase involved in cell wall biosynthesis
MQARVARHLDGVITVSETSRVDLVREMGAADAKVSVVPLGADHELFVPDRVPRSQSLILAVASADVVSKGVLPLLEALAKVRTEVDAELVIVSKASAAALAAVTRLGISSSVRFTTGLSDEELADLMSSAAVFAVPSLYEGFSLPAAEAMACATPLVVSAAGALPEVVGPDGLAALHVPPGDAEALAAAILRLLGDPALRARLGAAGRARVEAGLSWAATGHGTAEVYYAVREELAGA